MMENLKAQLLGQEFYLPATFDICAVFFFALTGALAAIRRGYDIIGLFAMALATGLGGALIRDGVFLQSGPPAMTKDWRLLAAVIAGCLAGWAMGHLIERYRKVIAVLDAVGLGAYSVVGVQKSLAAGLSIPAALLVGVINACGGGLLRDIIVREEPLMMKPGQFYVVASFLGCVIFVALAHYTALSAPVAALFAICATFVFRMLAIVFNWRTTPIQPWLFEPEEALKKDKPAQPEPKEKKGAG
jgi:uncharacterized membrane protein YeiH